MSQFYRKQNGPGETSTLKRKDSEDENNNTPRKKEYTMEPKV